MRQDCALRHKALLCCLSIGLVVCIADTQAVGGLKFEKQNDMSLKKACQKNTPQNKCTISAHIFRCNIEIFDIF